MRVWPRREKKRGAKQLTNTRPTITITSAAQKSAGNNQLKKETKMEKEKAIKLFVDHLEEKDVLKDFIYKLLTDDMLVELDKTLIKENYRGIVSSSLVYGDEQEKWVDVSLQWQHKLEQASKPSINYVKEFFYFLYNERILDAYLTCCEFYRGRPPVKVDDILNYEDPDRYLTCSFAYKGVVKFCPVNWISVESRWLSYIDELKENPPELRLDIKEFLWFLYQNDALRGFVNAITKIHPLPLAFSGNPYTWPLKPSLYAGNDGEELYWNSLASQWSEKLRADRIGQIELDN